MVQDNEFKGGPGVAASSKRSPSSVRASLTSLMSRAQSSSAVPLLGRPRLKRHKFSKALYVVTFNSQKHSISHFYVLVLG